MDDSLAKKKKKEKFIEIMKTKNVADHKKIKVSVIQVFQFSIYDFLIVFMKKLERKRSKSDHYLYWFGRGNRGKRA